MGDEAAVEIRDRPAERQSLKATRQIGRALGGARLVGVEETDGERLAWLRSPDEPHRAWGVEDPTAYDAVAAVRRWGAVVRLRERAEARDGGRRVEVTTTNRFSAIGETTVERPDWAHG